MTENEIRGRPKKENQQDNSQNILLNKYNKFFNSEKIKIKMKLKNKKIIIKKI